MNLASKWLKHSGKFTEAEIATIQNRMKNGEIQPDKIRKKYAGKWVRHRLMGIFQRQIRSDFRGENEATNAVLLSAQAKQLIGYLKLYRKIL